MNHATCAEVIHQTVNGLAVDKHHGAQYHSMSSLVGIFDARILQTLRVSLE